MKKLTSVSGYLVRLSNERWQHIIGNHPEMSNMQKEVITTLENPDIVTSGHSDELLAIKHYAKTPVSNDKYLVVVYKEANEVGFIITAYFTRKYDTNRDIIWKRSF